MKRNLLIISDSFLPRHDGVAHFLDEIIPLLIDTFNITVIAPDFSGEFVDPAHYTLVRIGLSWLSINDYPIAKFSSKTIRKHVKEADVVWTQDLSSLCFSGICAAGKFQKPLITFNHVVEWEIVPKALPGPRYMKHLWEGITKLFARRLYNKCDVLMVPSQYVEFRLEQNAITAAKVLVPLGVDIHHFVPTKNRDKSKMHLDIPKDSFVIGFVGRIGREKNLQTLFEAFKYVLKIIPKARLLIVGSGLVEETEMLHHPHVILAGAQDNVVPYFQAMDVFVLPSLTETTSLATIEAMACGVPVITTPLPALQEYIGNNENGMFFPKRNHLVLRKKILYLHNHPALQKQLSENGRKTVEERFSWQKTVELVKEVLMQY